MYVDEYHKKVLETNEMTRNRVNTVFENVTEIDTRYAGHTRECQVKIKEQIAIVNTMTEFMVSMTDVIPNKAHRSGGGSHANCDGTENNDESRQPEGVMGWDTGFVSAGFATIEREIDEEIITEVNDMKVGEEILLKYLIEQGIVIPKQQRGVLRLIWTERSDILGTLFIMECKGEEKDEVLEAAMEYYYSLQEGMTFSLERYDELRGLELADYHLNGTTKDPGGAGVYNDEGELIGIKPYYVMVNAGGGGFRDDGGITFGVGHNISAAEWKNESDREHQLLSGYIPQDVTITGIEVGSLPGCSLVIVPGSTMVPIEEVNRIFYEDIQEFSDIVANTLISQGIDVTQDEFDALVICAYNRGRLSSKMLNNLKNGNRNPTDWQDLWSGGNNREEYCQNLFFSIAN